MESIIDVLYENLLKLFIGRATNHNKDESSPLGMWLHFEKEYVGQEVKK